MKTYIKIAIAIVSSVATIFIFSSLTTKDLSAKELIGAWGYETAESKTVMIMTDKVFSVATYSVTPKKFFSSYGGTWHIEGDKIIRKIEWNSKDSLLVGTETMENVQLTLGKLVLKQTNETWTRLDDGTPGKLLGAWIITGTFSDDKASKRANPFYPRRTMKVLSGKYFHWIAYNVATKTFINAGGGTYTTVNGKYTENIEFFTKTPESVGKTLTFDYSIDGGDWRHRGQKSTGGVMDELWSKRETLDKN